MSEYNIKVSKLEDGSYKLKINNYSRYEVEEVEALAIKYLQKQLQQKENIIKFVIEEEKKIPEKLEEYIHTDSLNYNQCNYMFEKLTNKYNEIIDYLDYLKSKGE